MSNAKQKSNPDQPGALRRYFDESQDPFNSLIFIMPLFVAYQVGILFTGGMRNGVDFLTDLIFFGLEVVVSAATGSADKGDVLNAYLGFNGVVLVVLAAVIFVLRKQGSFRPRIWPYILIESAIYAVLFGSAVRLMIAAFGLDILFLIPDVGDIPSLATGDGKAPTPDEYSPFVALIQSIGAGLYEELVFRFALMTVLFALFTKGLGTGKFGAVVLSVIASSFLFSLAHHVGPLGDPFTLGVFTYRFFAGVLLAVIYGTRGLAVAVYTHAFYDVLVMVFR